MPEPQQLAPKDGEKATLRARAERGVPDADLESATLEMAQRLARGPALAMARAKELTYRGLAEGLEPQMENERQAIILCAGSDDFREGAEAFFERREARFR